MAGKGNLIAVRFLYLNLPVPTDEKNVKSVVASFSEPVHSLIHSNEYK